jgi:biotin-(acetyl-CoA carboxylase) ligase
MHVSSNVHKLLGLPPGFRAVAAARPWDEAVRAAADLAPGTLLHGPLDGLLDAALLLAPDRPIDELTVLRFTTLAVREVIAAAMPPNSTVTIADEGTVAVNLGQVADIRVASGPRLVDAIPAWLILGLTIRVALRLPAPGLNPGVTDLAEEGADVSAGALLEQVCRHLLAAIDLWQDRGAAGIERAWRAARVLAPA